MSKDDYFVLAYRILAYFYACLKESVSPNFEYLQYGTDEFPIGKDYWEYIVLHLYEDGYIEGVVAVPILGSTVKSVKLTDKTAITPKGIEYLQNNSAMEKAKQFLKDLKEMIPGL